jgi:ribosome-associated protein
VFRDMSPKETASSLKSDRVPNQPPVSEPASEDTVSREQRLQRERSLEFAIAIARAADWKKAEDILILDVSRTLGIADYFVIATARSRRQLAIVAEACDLVARRYGNHVRALEGGETGWVVGDFVDVVLHVFDERSRTFYDLEHLWADAPRVPWEPAPPEPAASPTSSPATGDSTEG